MMGALQLASADGDQVFGPVKGLHLPLRRGNHCGQVVGHELASIFCRPGCGLFRRQAKVIFNGLPRDGYRPAFTSDPSLELRVLAMRPYTVSHALAPFPASVAGRGVGDDSAVFNSGPARVAALPSPLGRDHEPDGKPHWAERNIARVDRTSLALLHQHGTRAATDKPRSADKRQTKHVIPPRPLGNTAAASCQTRLQRRDSEDGWEE